MEKVISFCFVIALVFLNFVECKNLDPAAEEFLKIVNAENIKATHEPQEKSDPNCTLQFHECTNKRHSCCRSMFKLECTCMYPEPNEGVIPGETEFCTCQKPWEKEVIETSVHYLKKLGF
ncbi:toxin-like structure LSTX-D1 isoform X1 [Parasteatoda tepidariorum]|uniref:toxin-like structure LSTX-D1 isoform X1 n=1 Tax=Parasteatoda tepidariorum TaxID=114398 RepID=UPI00077FCA3B|nr:U3-lycotoxin-Ls1w-like isoform X1 [Parasteatoda tepidariorum]